MASSGDRCTCFTGASELSPMCCGSIGSFGRSAFVHEGKIRTWRKFCVSFCQSKARCFAINTSFLFFFLFFFFFSSTPLMSHGPCVVRLVAREEKKSRWLQRLFLKPALECDLLTISATSTKWKIIIQIVLDVRAVAALDCFDFRCLDFLASWSSWLCDAWLQAVFISTEWRYWEAETVMNSTVHLPDRQGFKSGLYL